jgi:predicted aspartyl protease
MLRSLATSNSVIEFFLYNVWTNPLKNWDTSHMPYIQGRHDGRAAFVQVAIVDAARYVEHKQSKNLVLHGVRPFRALIDTGATSTMITKNVVSFLGLEPVTKLPYATWNGLQWVSAYLFHVAFYGSVVPLSADPEESESLVNSMRVCTKVKLKIKTHSMSC